MKFGGAKWEVRRGRLKDAVRRALGRPPMPDWRGAVGIAGEARTHPEPSYEVVPALLSRGTKGGAEVRGRAMGPAAPFLIMKRGRFPPFSKSPACQGGAKLRCARAPAAGAGAAAPVCDHTAGRPPVRRRRSSASRRPPRSGREGQGEALWKDAP
jgi:hypothetical protein